jgi:hypothetical protein
MAIENKKVQELHGREHKFFYRDLNLDLDDVTKTLENEYERIKKGEMRGVTPVNIDVPRQEIFLESNSVSTIKSREYNAFQMYYPFLHDLYSEVVDMTIEACEYYGIDYNEQKYVCQAWFNINNTNKGGKLDWHDHVPMGMLSSTAFHGYYSVSAEPSKTHYLIDGVEKINNNKNNRAILSRVGYPHAMADWNWEGQRITIAYDVAPLKYSLQKDFLKFKQPAYASFWEQHYFPLPQLKSLTK